MSARIIFVFLLVPSRLLSQNLVPNGGFESYINCPGTYAHSREHFQLPAWTSPSAGTPDHFSACSEGEADVPYNWAGVADAFEGKSYVGLFLWMRDKAYREYIQCNLTTPLVRDSLYHIRFHYKLSSYAKFSIDRIGLALTTSPLNRRDDNIILIQPTLSIVQDSALTPQTGLWEKAEFVFKASGGEQVLTIGNFWPQEQVHYYEIQFRPVSEPMLAMAAYYYIDDVQVISDTEVRKQKQIVNEIEYENLKTNTNYVLRNIQFEFDSYRLLTQSFEALDKLAMFLLKHPTTKIQLFGHTDDLGGDGYNQRLSERRAKNVGDYLVSVGVAADRIEAFGYGKKKPLIESSSEEARKMNRRVEIRFLR